MLKSSRYTVAFPINGLQFSGDLTFQPGITAVVGRNGTGKTLGTIEMARFGLFGKKALRGPSADYKRLVLDQVVSIKGKDYSIHRSAKGDKLSCGDKELAVGAEAVNAKVIELMGFGLDVFDICNASVQKQSSRLTQLTPGKRKELIDEVVGLDRNEAIEKECRNKAKLMRTEAEIIEQNVVKPEKPAKPTGYKASKALQAELETVREQERDRSKFEFAAERVITVPASPRGDIAAMATHEHRRLSIEQERATLSALIASIPTTQWNAEDIQQAEAVLAYRRAAAARGAEPTMPASEAEAQLRIWQEIFALEKVNVEVECPECAHKFQPSQTIPAKPPHAADYYTDQLARHRSWAADLKDPGGCIPELLQIGAINKAEIALDRWQERVTAQSKLDLLPKLEDKEIELRIAQATFHEWEAHDRLVKERDEAKEALAKLPPRRDLKALEEAFVAARIYESAIEHYTKSASDYLEKMAKATRLTQEAGEFMQGATALVEARRELKAYLAPSLSRVASSLISEMTCGKLESVVVDENMTVTVNGQSAETLSGAGETAANLALRLALGRTLVGGVFPVFFGDEVDADADEERSEAMFECVRNLRSQFQQVIIITHKPHVQADHVIDFDA